MRIINIPLLRFGAPPGDESQCRALAWVMSDGERILAGVLCAAVMAQSRVMRRLLVSGPLRERLASIMGMERLADALRYPSEDLAPVVDSPDVEDLRAIGYAVMYRYLRAKNVCMSRLLLRSMQRDDPCLGRSVAWTKRMKGHSCVPIGALVVDSF
ncbi:hypothetical protein ACFFJT_05370 [Dyella flava]|uniref:Uncharacterized protein n=1 Tax=Dyella flava TaxID=1920170 RepID=A0ABS2K7A1_9GAMM|nr:hypothetical protein [Dyella flava]MBM7126784.1 hypothetical protein [Dyella flava]